MKSLDSLADTDGFKEWVSREFPEGASMLDGVQRRSFVKLMAASFGLAGLGMTGCRRPEQVILPYGKSPEELIPGVPAYYATSQPTSRGFNLLLSKVIKGVPPKSKGIHPTFPTAVVPMSTLRQVCLTFTILIVPREALLGKP